MPPDVLSQTISNGMPPDALSQTISNGMPPDALSQTISNICHLMHYQNQSLMEWHLMH